MRTITTSQLALVESLAATRDASTFDAIIVARLSDARANCLPMGDASKLIDALMRSPRTAAAKAEPGIYVAPDGTAIKVVKSRESDRHYTKKLVFRTFDGHTTMDWQYAPGLNVAGLPRIDDTRAAEVGLSCNQCINCLAELGGESLSAKVSAVIGFGEKCAANNGWAYPKGVKAQRAFLAERGALVAA